MTGKTESEIIVAEKELHEIIAAAKELGIQLTNAKPGSELWEEAWGDPAKLCVDDGCTDECKAAIEDANTTAAPDFGCLASTTADAMLQGCSLAAFSEQVWCGAVHSLWESC